MRGPTRFFRLAPVGALIGAVVLVLVCLGWSRVWADATSPVPPVVLLTVNGAIDPITAGYVRRGLAAAAQERAGLVLIELDTPGGLDSAMRSITGAMLASPVPVVVYVTPAGARAGSAGVFILMAADVAAMAPGTNVGAAHPVGLGTSDLSEDERTKVTNDAAAYMRTLATARHHNATWAEEAVRSSVALTAEEALAQRVIDLVSPDRASLLARLNGWEVARPGGSIRFQTRGAPLEPLDMTLPERLLHLIDDPNVAYLLLSIGGWALLAELFHPGSVLPGVVGILCLALALTALASLPLSWTGLGLIIIALVLFVVDLKAATHGALTAAGLATFIVGSLMLFAPVPFAVAMPSPFQPGVNPVLILLIGGGIAAFFAFVVRTSLRSRRLPPMVIGPAAVGATGVAVTDLTPSGVVRVQGAEWDAEVLDGPVSSGEAVEVAARRGLHLIVRRVGPRKETGV